jgi:hypothetical protein
MSRHVHITSRRVTSCHAMSTSRRVVSHMSRHVHITSRRVTSRSVVSHHVTPCPHHVASCHIMLQDTTKCFHHLVSHRSHCRMNWYHVAPCHVTPRPRHTKPERAILCRNPSRMITPYREWGRRPHPTRCPAYRGHATSNRATSIKLNPLAPRNTSPNHVACRDSTTWHAARCSTMYKRSNAAAGGNGNIPHCCRSQERPDQQQGTRKSSHVQEVVFNKHEPVRG